MRSRWSRGGGEGQHPPVEMRFVDMFMTALGSLIFIAMLLVFLLPKAASSVSPGTNPETLAAQLAELNRELAKERQSRADLQKQLENVNRIDKHVVKRWLAVTLVTKGCLLYEPTLYVRWEGPIVSFDTGQKMGFLDPFNASFPQMHPLMGNRTYLIGPADGPGRLPHTWRGAAPTSLLDGTDVVVTSFLAVRNGPGDQSIYIGLLDPRGLKGGECLVQPIIHGWSWQDVGSVFKLSLAQPFAWIRRIRIENDGTFTSPAPQLDAAFQRELEAFSAEQSQKLCERKLICGTQDAHWARYAKPPPPPEGLEWRKEHRFTRFADRLAVRSPMTPAECERACLENSLCAAVEHGDERSSCSFYSTVPSVQSAPGSRSSVGIRPPWHWMADRAVPSEARASRTLSAVSRDDCAKACLEDDSCRATEYFKPKRTCSLFDHLPRIVPSPVGDFGPTDVGIRTRR